MRDLEIEKDQKPLDIREISELDHAFALADSIVMKNYLAKVDTCQLLDTLSAFDERPVYESASLFRVKKIVYNCDENNLWKLISMYSSAVGFNSNIVMIINSDGKEVELYLGTTGRKNIDSARASAEALAKILLAIFPEAFRILMILHWIISRLNHF